MEEIYVGKIVGTHGIKGELRIKSNVQYKDKIFKIGNILNIDKQKYVIKSYRRHKDYDMVTLNDYKDINDVLFLVKKEVYIDKESLELNDMEILDQDLVNYKAIVNNNSYNIVEVYYASSSNKLIRINVNGKEVLVPYRGEFIKKIDKDNKCIYIELIDGMIL